MVSKQSLCLVTFHEKTKGQNDSLTHNFVIWHMSLLVQNYFLSLSEEKKVKKYLEENFQNRHDLVNKIEAATEETDNPERKQYEGVGPRAKEGNLFENEMLFEFRSKLILKSN